MSPASALPYHPVPTNFLDEFLDAEPRSQCLEPQLERRVDAIWSGFRVNPSQWRGRTTRK